MGHQKLHLIGQDAAVAQNKVFPQAGHVGRVEQRHTRLLGGAAALAVVARAAGCHHIHPSVHAFLSKGHDVFAGQFGLVIGVAAVGAYIAIADKQLGVGEAGAKVKGVDVGHALGANDAVDSDDGLLSGDGVVSTMKHSDFAAGFPTNLVCRVMQNRFL